MKFYVHCEDPGFTVVVNWDASKNDSLNRVRDMFVQRLKDKFSDSIRDSQRATLYNRRGVPMDLTEDVLKQIKHMDDIYIRFDDATVGKLENLNALDEDVYKGELSIMEDKAADKCPVKEKTLTGETPNGIEQLIEEKNNAAIVFVGNEKYRNAITLYREIHQLDPTNKRAMKGLVTCLLRAGRIKDGLNSVNSALKNDNSDLELLLLKGRLLIDSGDGDNAIETLLTFTKIARQKGGINSDEKHDVQVLLAKGYLLKQQKDMAINILQGILRENQENVVALAEYANILFPLGSTHAEEAMDVLLTLLAKNPDDKNVKQKFADVCSSLHGMTVLRNVAGKAMQDVAALVFLATSLRDFGAIKEAIELMEQAMKVDPGNAHTLLTYVHMLELVDRPRNGISRIKDFVHTFPAKHVNSLACSVIDQHLTESNDDCYETKDVSEILESLESLGTDDKIEYSDEERYLLAVFFTLVKLLYVTAELRVIPSLLKRLEPCCHGRNLHLTNIRNEAAYFTCIAEIFRSWSKSPVSLHQRADLSERKFIYYLGDSHCIPPAWQEIHIMVRNTCSLRYKKLTVKLFRKLESYGVKENT